ncbi:dihydrofolate reductase family protein [Alkalihalophilus lindianensis]|uniref:Dihydrofolate reductase family protein n=1 Tax=Alkalihalophilus lindianensis TaxID=1630542 RepID=A0ABU3X4N1_9BACI|nr:dihydrofolate reductase family protein [Alkalihalophilus lindianensis]MDV2682753.1 dihydrofolate reductase family protein [Alkalihalophilus lindianensis]
MSQERNVVLFIATSLDGYIATEEERLDWLFEVEGEGDNGISDFYKTVDTVLMGRKTYDWIINADSIDEYPYKDKHSFVFTRSTIDDNDHTHFINHDVEAFVRSLKRKQGKNIWLLGGGQLVTTCIEKDLVDEIIITVAPKIIGSGIPLFIKGKYKVNLSLEGVQTFNQFVELHYKVRRD